jgi:hypothetical protein
MKSPHINITENLDNKIREYAKDKKINYSKAIAKLLFQGFMYEEHTDDLHKLIFEVSYLIRLNEQAYTDLEIQFDKNVNSNKRLKDFKNKLGKDSLDD